MPTLTFPETFPVRDIIAEVSPHDPVFAGDPAHYLSVGRSALEWVESTLDRRVPRTILDFPCGYGRVTRFLRARFPTASITACDFDPDAVAFCNATFVARGVQASSDLRDLDLGRLFDVLWFGSLLTGLDRSAIRDVLAFAARHMHDESRLIVTTFGRSAVARLRHDRYGLGPVASRGLAGDYLSRGFAFRSHRDGRGSGVALLTPDWLGRVARSHGLATERHAADGWDRQQDVYVLRQSRAMASGMSASASDRFDDPEPVPAVLQDALDEASFEAFDAAWYLARYPDVAAAVSDRHYTSGLQHFLERGWFEDRAPCRDADGEAA